MLSAISVRPFSTLVQCAVVVVAASLATPAALGQQPPPANNGRYLPGTTTLPFVNNFGWIRPGQPTEFDAAVECGGVLLGNVRMTYDMWQGTSSRSGRMTGGAALAGGFFMNTDPVMQNGVESRVTLCDGYQLRWVQITRSTINGITEWGVANNTWHPDTFNGRTSPAYPTPGQQLPMNTTPPNPPPNPGFADFPGRFPHQGNQSFDAELALCALNAANHECCILGSFTWGYDVTMNPAGFTPRALGAWTPGGSPNLFNVLTDAFDGNGLVAAPPRNTSTVWNINDDCCDDAFCIMPVPAPSAAGVLGLGGVVALRRKRRG